MLCAMFGWNWPSGSGEEFKKKTKMWKDYDNNNGDNNDEEQMIRKAHLSLQAQVNLKVLENLPLEKATVWQIAKTHAMLS